MMVALFFVVVGVVGLEVELGLLLFLVLGFIGDVRLVLIVCGALAHALGLEETGVEESATTSGHGLLFGELALNYFDWLVCCVGTVLEVGPDHEDDVVEGEEEEGVEERFEGDVEAVVGDFHEEGRVGALVHVVDVVDESNWLWVEAGALNTERAVGDVEDDGLVAEVGDPFAIVIGDTGEVRVVDELDRVGMLDWEEVGDGGGVEFHFLGASDSCSVSGLEDSFGKRRFSVGSVVTSDVGSGLLESDVEDGVG